MSVKTLTRKGAGKDVITAARERISYCYDRFDHVAVAFSGGKDSTVVLNLVIEEAARRGLTHPVDVIHFDEEAVPYETEQYVRRVHERPDVSQRWLCLPLKHRNACSPESPYWYPWDAACPEKWVRPLPPEGITQLPGFSPRLPMECNGLLWDPAEVGTVAVMLGLRASESMVRYRNVLKRRKDNYIFPDSGASAKAGIYRVSPIYDFTTPDIWAAIGQNDWDYNVAYDIMHMSGIAPDTQRCAPPYGEEPVRGLWMFKVCFPDIWEKMHNRVPGSATAARYSRTPLWRSAPKPASSSWQEHIAQQIGRLAHEARKTTASAIRYGIEYHYRQTTDPILPYTKHPLSGVSWQWLARQATKGTLKRRSASPSHRREPDEKHWVRYRREKEELDAAGADYDA